MNNRGAKQQKEEQRLVNLLEEIISENFLEVGKKKITQAQRVPNKVNPKKPTPRHIIITMANVQDKERILKAARERWKVTFKGSPIRLSNDFSTETHQARKEWTEIYKVMQSKGLNPRILYPARLSFKLEGEIRSFTDKKKAKGVYHHQASNARNAKGTGVKRRIKSPERKQPHKKRNGYKHVPFNNNLKRKRTKCSNQKTLSG
uniref:L1 transposable element RRM domain-containing protein n=1 Tax=Myotis myotis TaxID=51298 RepID=A0A7J7YE16_MYOMY|nr:hypothetical protein mMyoMyo1_011177 [Myotis myotis]